ncbi:bifunctional adenosylcobinamide kinase/adenosylcobinamide-phosphate guanylyltransferase [Marinobacter caseinilyticus]|uniref:bifunctional adenosylcobinamide kinase/adenosylcobinamide-phosphate guanylyltransferase n=1 Tax=Marinobacter caseinilyticus TaxID=2692195 RepID=UPI0014078DE7|nr:bifunctional adenosylcobinamide kinase/adenosylcobinamide-phosphate guanylyltransferase [Marinobacter caseinilyticus]
MSAKHTLVLGGIRSGKTALAEQQASATGMPVVYVATATAGDDEMAGRIERHQAQRPVTWGLIEVPQALAGAMTQAARQTAPPCLLIDCMSLWLSNLMHAGTEVMARERAAFLDAVVAYPGNLVVVSNEVGLGTIGMDPLTRAFCDQLGWLNQALAERCDRVLMSVAGLPLKLK